MKLNSFTPKALLLLCVFFVINYNSAICQEIIHEGFDNGTTPPDGWIFNISKTTYTSATGSGENPPSLQFNALGQFIETTDFSGANELSFWLKGYSTDVASAFVVKCKVDNNWKIIDSLVNLSHSEKTITIPLPSGASKVRFEYDKSAGNLAFDDVVISYIDSSEYSNPPIFTNSSPIVYFVTDTMASIKFSANKMGRLLYIVSRNDSLPILKNDFLHHENMSKSELFKFGDTLINDTVHVLKFCGLQKNTEYTFYWLLLPINLDTSKAIIYKSTLKTKFDDVDLFFSEVDRGSSNNKAIEFYNPQDEPVCLDNYRISQASNGGGWSKYFIFKSGTYLAPHKTFVILYSKADTAKINKQIADSITSNTVVNYTGNDARGLQRTIDEGLSWEFIDVYGDALNNQVFTIAGIENAASPHSVLRKTKIRKGNPDWKTSAGTDSLNSEWIVMPKDYFYDLGFHYISLAQKVILTSIFSESLEFSVIDTSKLLATLTVKPNTDLADLKIQFGANESTIIESSISNSVNYTSPFNICLKDKNTSDSSIWKIIVLQDSAPRIKKITKDSLNNNQLNVWLNKKIAFHPDNLIPDIKLFQKENLNNVIPCTFEFDSALLKLSIIPESSLIGGSKYILSIDSIYDLYTNKMEPYEYEFISDNVNTNFDNTENYNEINIWPNPFNSLVHIKIKGSNEFYKLSLISLNGKVMMDLIVKNNFIYDLNSLYLSEGVYFIRDNNVKNPLINKFLTKKR